MGFAYTYAVIATCVAVPATAKRARTAIAVIAVLLAGLLGGCAVDNSAREPSVEIAADPPPAPGFSPAMVRLPPVWSVADRPGFATRAVAQTRPNYNRPVVQVSYNNAGEADSDASRFDWPEDSPVDIRLRRNEVSGPKLAGPEHLPAPRGFTPITLHLDNVDVRKALEMLSRQASVGILVAPGVTGQVTANLENLSFDDALSAILRVCNLVAHRDKGLVFVYTPDKVPQLEQRVQVFTLDYLSPEDVLETVGEKGGDGLLSPVGKASKIESSSDDNRKTRNAIIVEDSPDNLRRIAHCIAEVDRPPRQVLIEVHVLEVALEDDLEHGVNFDNLMHIEGNTPDIMTRGFAGAVKPKDLPTGELASAILSSTAGPAFFTRIAAQNLAAVVQLLKTTTDAKTLAAPRLLVVNGQEAQIQIGEKLGYRDTKVQTQTSTTEAVKFLELGVVLKVTPYITGDNRILMRVNPQVATGRINPDTELPEEETSEVETNVLLEDGQGMVIGGLIKEKDHETQHKVPLLGDLWLVGRLFQKRKVEKQRVELVIVLLPRVLPYLLEDELRNQSDMSHAAAPLFHGPLKRCPRSWESRLPDARHRP